MTQGRTIVAALKKRPHTYMEMLSLGVSVAPWMRVREALLPTETVIKGKRHMGGKRYLTTWAVK